MRLVCSLVCLVVVLCLPVSVYGQTAEKPNVILITIDDCNDWLSFMEGHEQAFTPNLQALANEGLTFTNAYTTTPVCAPSRTSYLTGKSSEYTGIYSNEQYIERLGPDRIFRNAFQPAYGNSVMYTLPEWLKDSGGYFTVGVGKNFHGWMTGGHDNDTELDEPNRCDRSMSWSHNFAIDNDEPEPIGVSYPWHDGVDGIQAGPLADHQEDEMIDYATADSAVQFLQLYQSNPSAFCDRPFFLAVGMYRPHIPLTVPEKYFSDFYQPDLYQEPYNPPFNNPRNAYPRNGIHMPELPYDHPYSDFSALPMPGQIIARGSDRHGDFNTFASQLSSEPVIADSLASDQQAKKKIIANSRRANVVMSYLAALTFVDAQVGRVINQLNSNPQLAENTIIIVMSDHGLSFGKKMHWQKNGLWDTDIRVPFLIIDPSRSGGGTSAGTVSTLDLFPTLCDMLGIPEPTFPDGSRYLDGVSMMPLVDNPGMAWSRPVLTSIKLPDRIPKVGCNPHYSVRTDRWHYIRYRTSSDCDPATASFHEELYDVGVLRENDPEEWHNLAGQSEFSAIKNWMANFLPGGCNYNMIPPVLGIRALGDVPCGIDSNSSFSLVPELTFDADTEGLNLVWRYGHADSSNIKTDTLVFDAAAMPAGFWDDNKELVVYLEALDSLGNTRGMETHRIPFASQSPDASFAVQQSGHEVTLLPNDEKGLQVIWDFGDGVTVEDRFPGAHTYTRPAAYIASQTVKYGEGLVCSTKSTDTIFLDASAFDSVCLTPSPPTIMGVGPDRVVLSWNKVYQAVGYEWRVRKTSVNPYPWIIGNASVRSQVRRTIRHLFEGNEYEVQTRARCSYGDTSRWSALVYFETAPCRPPLGFEVETTDSSALVSWVPREEATRGYSMALMNPDMTPLVPDVALAIDSGVTQVTFEGLEDGKDYLIAARSRCDQIFSSQYYAGRKFAAVNFTADEAPVSRIASEEHNISMTIHPNPADEQAKIILGAESGTAVLTVYDLKGTEMASAQLEPGQVWTVDVSEWPVGNYLVSAQGIGRVVQQLVVSR